jgi:putative ABC transport system permease protein
MFKLNFKIALRNLWKNKVYTAINIGGLSIALAAFILVILYVTYETSYDKDVPNYDRIYQVGRSLPDFKTEYTPAPLAKAIKDHFPEIEMAGRTKSIPFEFPMTTDHGRVYTKKALQLDQQTAKMFNIIPSGGPDEEKDLKLNMYIPELFRKQLFPDPKLTFPQFIMLGPKAAAQKEMVWGTIDRVDEHSNLKFDIVVIGRDIAFNDQDYGTNNHNTYIQVKQGANILALEKKIDQLYKRELIKSGVPANDRRIAGRSVIFLDALKNLHLKPIAGNDTNYKVVMALFGLSILILIIACINFTNLSIVLATKRAKEVGIKKVMGAYRLSLTFQFITEIFMQCFIALVLALVLAEIMLPLFNSIFNTPLSIWTGISFLTWQLPLILVLVTLISGIYPAMVLSGYKPVQVLKGNFQTSYKTLWLRNSLLIGQFGIAIVFIVGLLVVNSQLKYMRAEDTGFKPDQVLYIKNIVLFREPWSFEPLHEKILKIPGVNNVTIASNLPDGSKPGTNTYKIDGKEATIDFIFTDYDYFETLGIELKEGRFFSKEFKSDEENGAVLNETAVARYGIINPVGKTIRGCGIDYKIVGVIKDFKSQGFERAINPTIYTIKNPCSFSKDKIMINIDQSRMSLVVAALKKQWPDINKTDGDDFRYEFVNELYGRLFKKQEQLQSVFFFAAVLTIFIALLGLFAFSAFTIANRVKEISIRKILGATDLDVYRLLNSYFVWIVLVANLIAWPAAYLLARKWLGTFAYRIEMPLIPFITAAVISTIITVLTVSIQVRKAVKTNPADALKYE